MRPVRGAALGGGLPAALTSCEICAAAPEAISGRAAAGEGVRVTAARLLAGSPPACVIETEQTFAFFANLPRVWMSHHE